MRRFLPSAIIFIAVIGCLWLYVTRTTPTDLENHSPFDALNDPEFAALVEREGRARDMLRGLKPGAAPAASGQRAPGPQHREARARERRRDFDLRWRDFVASAGKTLTDMDDAVALWRGDWLGSPEGRTLSGWAACHAGRFQAALASFEEALEGRPDLPAALSGRAEALLALGRLAEAAGVFERVASCRPHDTHALYNLGVVLVRLGDAGRATDAFRAVLQVDPRHARAAYNLAGLSQRDGRLSEARTWWQRYTELRPDVAAGWFNLGVVHLDFDQAAEAIRCFSYVVVIDPDQPDGYVNLAHAYRVLGDVDAALSALLFAHELAPCDAAVMQPLAELHRAAAARRPLERDRHLAAAALLEEQLAGLFADAGEGETGDRTAGLFPAVEP